MPTELITYEPTFSSAADPENDYPPLDTGMNTFQVSELDHQDDSQELAKKEQQTENLQVSGTNSEEDDLRHAQDDSRDDIGGGQTERISKHDVSRDQPNGLQNENDNPTKVYLYDDPHLENDPKHQQVDSNDNVIVEKLNEGSNLKQDSNIKTPLDTTRFFETSSTLELHRSATQNNNAPSPSEPVEQPFYVNAKQYYRILKRRYARAKLEENLKISRERRPYLHESRHKHAMRRPRGQGGRFLTAAEMAEMKRKEEVGTGKGNIVEEDVPRMNVLPQQLPGPIKDNTRNESEKELISGKASN
ncbi:unnamed protein product [Kluyveromyces dobzhanskii CBS 2104]|uniref:Transcriptional activator HAP2 n=1 Tax=Kluyveromyces dobzhanskii CBS 2104 TaxID=1427455 RepID=A0A0A8L0I8_9SACH|nr:unnamed protein product [Kluyveromyces dobzhanskii CBS 2104]